MKRRLKVLHLINSADRSFYLCAIADHVDRDRFDITVASLAPAGTLQADISARGVSTFSLDCTRRAQYPRAILRLVNWLKRQPVDVIQTHLFEASFVGLVAARLAGTPLALFTGHHSHDVVFQRKKLPLWIDCLSSRWLSHYIIAPSEDVKEVLIRDEGVPHQKIAVIPYGFDMKHWQPDLAAREKIRNELGLNGKIVLGAAGRLYWIKDYPCLLKAFAAVDTELKNVILLIVGGGEQGPLRKLAQDLGIQDRVVFAGLRADIVDVLAAMDVFVHSSLTESFGQVIVEAFVSGKPVVSTNVGVAREIIENGVNGFVVPTGDCEALRKALEAILRMRDHWPEMGEEGHRRVKEFSAEKIVPVYEAQYLEWLGARGKLNGADRSA
jgi:glycosyltransferase involved in cell wall biosynthesis